LPRAVPPHCVNAHTFPLLSRDAVRRASCLRIEILQNVQALAELVGVSEFEIYRYAYRAHLHYRQFRMAKQCGGSRTISAPIAGLKVIQRRISKHILLPQELHDAATGYRRGRSIVSNACVHADRDFVFNADIKDFFGSIRAKRVRSLFVALGFPGKLSGFLTRLCTYHGVLPQGAPTSPLIANLVCRLLDERIASYCAAHGFTYTRYCDDITISGNGKFTPAMQQEVFAIVESEGFAINQNKVRLATKRGRQMVTGLVVNRFTNMTRDQRRKLRAIFHQASLDPAKYACMLSKLQGCIGLLEMIRPDDPSLFKYKAILATLSEA
jgi:retron-type reverse transcriptase